MRAARRPSPLFEVGDEIGRAFEADRKRQERTAEIRRCRRCGLMKPVVAGRGSRNRPMTRRCRRAPASRHGVHRRALCSARKTTPKRPHAPVESLDGVAAHGQRRCGLRSRFARAPNARCFAQRPTVRVRTRAWCGHTTASAFHGSVRPLRRVFRAEHSDAAVHAMVESLALFGIGASWGGYESLALRPPASSPAAPAAAISVVRSARFHTASKARPISSPTSKRLGVLCAHRG